MAAQTDADNLRMQAELLERVWRHVSQENGGDLLWNRAQELRREAIRIEERLPA